MQRPSGLRWECGEELKTAKGGRCGWSSVGNEVGEKESWSQIYKGATWRCSRSQHPHVHKQLEAERRNGGIGGRVLDPFLFELEVSVDFFF